MDEALYLLQVSLCVAVFYSLYILVFRCATFFLVNRIFLLVSLVFSFVIPKIHLSLVMPVVPMDYHIMSAESKALSSIEIQQIGSANLVTSSDILTNFLLLLPVIYWTGFVFMLMRILFSIIQIYKIKNRSSIEVKETYRIVRTDVHSSFSFFNLIFLSRHENNPLILEHEKVHVDQYHWIDLLIMEVANVILWFNPVMVFYKRSLKIQHEYLADADTVSRSGQLEHYLQSMLLQIKLENEGQLTSFFNSQTIKNRIIMMTKSKTPRKFSVLYLLSVPAACLLLFSFSIPSVSNLPVNNDIGPIKEEKMVIIVDAGHGGEDKGAYANTKISEKEFVLSIAKKIQKVGEERNVKVILTRTGDRALTLENRTLFSNRFEADLFISLHVNYNKHNAEASGMECFVSENNTKGSESKRFASQLVNELQLLKGIAVGGIKTFDFYVVKNNSVPAVLLELGYLSNEKDYAYILDDENQKLISERIITAVLDYSK